MRAICGADGGVTPAAQAEREGDLRRLSRRVPLRYGRLARDLSRPRQGKDR